MAILQKGIINVFNGAPQTGELIAKANLLPGDDEYGFILFDKEENPMLPMIRYINGILIAGIHRRLKQQGYNVTHEGLYRMFEQKYTPEIVEYVGEDKISYHNMKGMKTKELSEVAEKIKEYGKSIGVEFPTRRQMKKPAYNHEYVELQSKLWKTMNRRRSSL